jgi:N-acetylglutamate synthase-like GNAT family acetyltransferase
LSCREYGFLIRPANAGDVDRVHEVVRDAYAVYVPRIGREPAPMGADYASLVREGVVNVAVAEGAIVGVLVLRQQSDSLLLENVAVAPAEQGRGVGRALLAFTEHRARELALAKITLYTNARMTENLSFYRRLGYVEVDRRREQGFDRVFFEKAVDRV